MSIICISANYSSIDYFIIFHPLLIFLLVFLYYWNNYLENTSKINNISEPDLMIEIQQLHQKNDLNINYNKFMK